MLATDPHGSSRPFAMLTQDAKTAEKTFIYILVLNLKNLILSLTLFAAPREIFFRFRSENLFSHPFAMLTQDTKITKETHYSGFDLQPINSLLPLFFLVGFVRDKLLILSRSWPCVAVAKPVLWVSFQFLSIRAQLE